MRRQRKPLRKSFSLALCGVGVAVALVVLLIGAVIPAFLMVAPGIAGILVMVVCAECGLKMAMSFYTAVAILGLILIPEKECIFLFIFFLGYYALVKAKIERIHVKTVCWVLKFLLFNSSMVAMYSLLYVLFPVGDGSASFAQAELLFGGLLLLLGNVAFFFYDRALVNVLRLYMAYLRPKLFG